MLLKKWLILVVLSCTIFAVSSGCSGSGENKTADVAEDNEENDSGDIVKDGEESSSGNAAEEVEVKSTGDSDNWCLIGSSWKTTNPQTGEEITMNVVGTENVDGVLMCKAVYETNTKDENFSKVEYFWSKDGNKFFWTAYDKSESKSQNSV